MLDDGKLVARINNEDYWENGEGTCHCTLPAHTKWKASAHAAYGSSLDDREWMDTQFAGDGDDSVPENVFVVEASPQMLVAVLLFVLAVSVLVYVACKSSTWCRGNDAKYSKVRFASETDNEENIAINDGDDQL